MKFEDLSPELQEKVKACKTPDDMFKLVKAEAVELTQEQLELVAGGGGAWSQRPCPKCGSYVTGPDMPKYVEGKPSPFVCYDCGHTYLDTIG